MLLINCLSCWHLNSTNWVSVFYPFQVSPVLKHKQQRGVACLAWRPYLASELAVGCLTGILIWTVDPLSVVARPSANCVYILPTPSSHLPVTGLAYHPEGKYLLSSSAHDSSVIIWCTSSERQVPIKCINRFHDGIQLASWWEWAIQNRPKNTDLLSIQVQGGSFTNDVRWLGLKDLWRQ